jgi:hypothetical protein
MGSPHPLLSGGRLGRIRRVGRRRVGERGGIDAVELNTDFRRALILTSSKPVETSTEA